MINKASRCEKIKHLPFFYLAPCVISLWGLAVFGNYYLKFLPDFDSIFTILNPAQYYIGNIKVFGGHLANIAVSLLFVFAHFSLGRRVLNFFKLDYNSALEETVFSIGAGLGIFANYVFLISALGALSFAPVAIPLACLIILGFRDIYKKPLGSFSLLPEKFNFWDFSVLAILLAAMAFNLAGALSPEIFYDALVYHLAVPNYYVINGGMLDMPHNLYSNLPMLHGMLYAAGLLIKDEFIPKFINYFAGVLIVFTIMAMALRYFNKRIGVWAALIFYSITQVMTSSWSVGTETLLAFFALLSLYAVINSGQNGNWFFISAFFSGLAMAVKYTGLIVSAGVMTVYLGLVKKIDFSAIKKLIVFIIIGGAIVSPWLIKNYVYRSNPVYPFMTNVFTVKDKALDGKIKGFMAETSQKRGRGFKSWVFHPWDITMGTIGGSSYFSPLFLFLLPIVFLTAFGKKYGVFFFAKDSKGKPTEAEIVCPALTIYFLTAWLLWSLFSTRVRFLIPAFPAAAILISHFANNRESGHLRNILRGLIIFSVLVSCFWAGAIFYTQERWKAFFGQLSKKDFLSATRTYYSYAHYPALNFVNEKLPEDSKTLIVGDSRSFYIKRNFIASSVFDLSPIAEYAKHSETGAEMRAKMKKDKITHILLNNSEARRLEKNYNILDLDDKSFSVLSEFWHKYAKEIFVKEEKIENPSGVFTNRLAVFELT